MKTLTAKDAKYGFGRLIDLARAEPVTVAKHRRPGAAGDLPCAKAWCLVREPDALVARQLHADAGFAEGGRALVADHAAGLSGNADQGW